MPNIINFSTYNYQIERKLGEKGIEIIGVSKSNCELINFSQKSKDLCDKLFSFLLENRMNRYLFSLMLRTSPDINSWILNNSDTMEASLEKYTFNDSFCKKYHCKDCKHLLKRIYAPELVYIQINDIIECPLCGLKTFINPKEYVPDYRLLPVDLNRFSKKLEEINVIFFKKDFLCSKCNLNIDDSSLLMFPNKCPHCGGHINEKTKAEFNDPFLKTCHREVGLWLEWFIYEIANHVYDHVEHGLILNYTDDEGKSCEKEVDIVALKDDKLFLIECKDYIGSTPPNQYQSIVHISPQFDETIVVNFYKAHKDVKKVAHGCPNIQILSGNEIDEILLSEDLIISHILVNSWFGIKSISRLSIGRQHSLIKRICENIESADMKKALIEIIEDEGIQTSVLWDKFSTNHGIILKSVLETIDQASNSDDIMDELRLLKAYLSKIEKNKLSEISNPHEVAIAIAGAIQLNSNYDSIIRQMYSLLFKNYTIEELFSGITDDTVYDNLYRDLQISYYLNYYWNYRVTTLKYISFIFKNVSSDCVKMFLSLIDCEFKNPEFHTGDVADYIFGIVLKFKNKFENERQLIELAEHLQKNGINPYVRNSASRFLDNFVNEEKLT